MAGPLAEAPALWSAAVASPEAADQTLIPAYDLFTRVAGVRALHERTVQLADIAAGQTVLDVGCGTGNLARAVLAAQPEAQVAGLDPDGDHHGGHGHGLLHVVRHLPRMLRSRVAQSPPLARGDGLVTLIAEGWVHRAREVEHVDQRIGRISFVQATRT